MTSIHAPVPDAPEPEPPEGHARRRVVLPDIPATERVLDMILGRLPVTADPATEDPDRYEPEDFFDGTGGESSATPPEGAS